MKFASKKRKGSLLQNFVRDRILKTFPNLKKKDVMTPSYGQTGPDIIFSKAGLKLVGWNFEVKNQNKMKGVYDWYKQSKRHSRGNKLKPCVVMKMNSRDPLVIIDFEDFLKLIKVDD